MKKLIVRAENRSHSFCVPEDKAQSFASDYWHGDCRFLEVDGHCFNRYRIESVEVVDV